MQELNEYSEKVLETDYCQIKSDHPFPFQRQVTEPNNTKESFVIRHKKPRTLGTRPRKKHHHLQGGQRAISHISRRVLLEKTEHDAAINLSPRYHLSISNYWAHNCIGIRGFNSGSVPKTVFMRRPSGLSAVPCTSKRFNPEPFGCHVIKCHPQSGEN